MKRTKNHPDKCRDYSFFNATRVRKIRNIINSLLGFVGRLGMLDCEVFSKLMGLVRLKQYSVLIGFWGIPSLRVHSLECLLDIHPLKVESFTHTKMNKAESPGKLWTESAY